MVMGSLVVPDRLVLLWAAWGSQAGQARLVQPARLLTHSSLWRYGCLDRSIVPVGV